MTKTYECMFLLDNEVVRTGWKEAKANLKALIEKHGGTVETSRRWAERRLAYPIRHRNRATYLLAYCNLTSEGIAPLRVDLDISEAVLRYQILSADAVPDTERELAAVEDGDDFVVPEPPADDAVDEPAPEASEETEEPKASDEKKEGDDAKEPEQAEPEAESPEASETEPAVAATSEEKGD